MRKNIISAFKEDYIKSSGTLLGWMAIRSIAQALLVVLMARTLGATQYGQYVGVLAIAAFLTPFAGLGLSSVLLRNGAKNPDLIDVYLTRSIRVWLVSSVACVLIAMILAKVLLPTQLPWIAAFSAITAEIIASSLTDLSARYLQAQHKTSAFGVINAGLIIFRLTIIGASLSIPTNTNIEWVLWAHTASSLSYAALLFWILPARSAEKETPELMTVTTGLPFSLAAFSVRVQGEFNKPVLAHLGFSMAGNYNAAQRVNDLVSIPLIALQEALWPKLYSHRNPKSYLWRSGIFIISVSIISSCTLWYTAPYLPLLLGDDFVDAANVMRSLAWLPILQVFRGLINFIAIHAGYMRLIGWAYVIGALSSIICVYALVPTNGMAGAVTATYITEVFMISILMIGIYLRKKHEFN